MQHKIIFLFADGVGLAPTSDTNPLSFADTPALNRLLGGPLTSERVQQQDRLLLKGIDANLGVPGLPQSGTGHVALLVGVNAPALHGRHQPHAPPIAQEGLLAEQSIFRQVQARGGTALFANPFGPRYWQALAVRKVRRSASVIAAMGAELRLRDLDDYRAGRALAWDISGAMLHGREGSDLPLRTPAEAGAILASLSDETSLVFFECFLPDLAGHGRAAQSDEEALTLLDGCIGGCIEAMDAATTLVLTSDHGNIEDRTTRVHTRNPVPLLIVGPAAPIFAAVEDIAGVAGAIMEALFGSIESVGECD